jgi:hypothetical protein
MTWLLKLWNVAKKIGFKLHFEHSSLKKISTLRFNDLYVLANDLLLMSAQ